MEIDVRDESEEITIIRFSDDGVIKVGKMECMFGSGVDVYDGDYFPFSIDEVDNMIKALKKLKEIAN